MARWQYQGHVEPVSLTGETPQLDKWQPVYETVMRPRKALLAAIVCGSCFLVDVPRAGAIDKWAPSYPDRIDRAKRIQPLEGVLPPFVPVAETVTLDKWSPTYPVRIDARRTATQPALIAADPLVKPTLDWLPRAPERLDRARRIASQDYSVLPPFVPAAAETITPDKWQPTYPDRLARAQRAIPQDGVLPPFVPAAGGGWVCWSDNFNRADGSMGANWTQRFTSPDNLVISSQAVVGNIVSNLNAAIYTGRTWIADQSSQAKLITDGSRYGGVTVRTSFASGVFTGYAYLIDQSNNQRILYRIVNNAFTSLASVSPHGFTSGSTIKIEVVGSTIKCYIDGVQDSGIGTITDANIATGSPGITINLNPAGVSIDDWQGCEAAAAETITSDKWSPSYPDRLTAAARTLWAGWFVVDPLALTRPETTRLDKWEPEYPNRLDRARRVSSLDFSVLPPFVPVAAETITPDKWLPTYPDRLDRARRIQPLEFRCEGYELPILDKWQPIYPNRLDASRRVFWQGFYAVDPWALTRGEVVFIDRWAPIYPVRLDRAQRIAPLDWGTADAWLSHVPTPPVAGPARFLALMGVGS